MSSLNFRSGSVRAGLLVNVILAVTLTLRLIQGTQAESLLATPAHPRDVASTVSAVSPSSPRLDPIQQNALFYPARQYYTPPPVTAQVPKPNYRLTGSFIVPDHPAIAMLAPAGGGAARKVSPGADLDGWTVLSVDASHVVLRLNDEMYEINHGTPNIAARTSTVSIVAPATVPSPTASVSSAPMIPAPVALASSSGIRVLGNGGATTSHPSAGIASSQQMDRSHLFQPPPH